MSCQIGYYVGQEQEFLSLDDFGAVELQKQFFLKSQFNNEIKDCCTMSMSIILYWGEITQILYIFKFQHILNLKTNHNSCQFYIYCNTIAILLSHNILVGAKCLHFLCYLKWDQSGHYFGNYLSFFFFSPITNEYALLRHLPYQLPVKLINNNKKIPTLFIYLPQNFSFFGVDTLLLGDT